MCPMTMDGPGRFLPGPSLMLVKAIHRACFAYATGGCASSTVIEPSHSGFAPALPAILAEAGVLQSPSATTAADETWGMFDPSRGRTAKWSPSITITTEQDQAALPGGDNLGSGEAVNSAVNRHRCVPWSALPSLLSHRAFFRIIEQPDCRGACSCQNSIEFPCPRRYAWAVGCQTWPLDQCQ